MRATVLDGEVLAHERRQREQRVAVEHQIHVAVVAQHAVAFGQELPEGLGVVVELLEPLAAAVGPAAATIVADDAPAPELQMPIHARVGGVGRDQIDRIGRQLTKKRKAVSLPQHQRVRDSRLEGQL
jgi:hypothetical protein